MGGTGGCVPLCAPFLCVQGSVAKGGRGGAREKAVVGALMRIPPVRMGRRGGSQCRIGGRGGEGLTLGCPIHANGKEGAGGRGREGAGALVRTPSVRSGQCRQGEWEGLEEKGRRGGGDGSGPSSFTNGEGDGDGRNIHPLHTVGQQEERVLLPSPPPFPSFPPPLLIEKGHKLTPPSHSLTTTAHFVRMQISGTQCLLLPGLLGPPFSPVRTPFAQKGGAQGHVGPSPSPSPGRGAGRCPVHAGRGVRGTLPLLPVIPSLSPSPFGRTTVYMQERGTQGYATLTPPFPFEWKGCMRARRPLAPFFPLGRAIHAEGVCTRGMPPQNLPITVRVGKGCTRERGVQEHTTPGPTLPIHAEGSQHPLPLGCAAPYMWTGGT
ncbi:hypothetical protein EDB85DRAFT_1895699 [Lactarius pseudohatsudake]|nr:hypothetical protein EDB85DRAFT_1895699 [Lactarius pseudohatsudake]